MKTHVTVHDHMRNTGHLWRNMFAILYVWCVCWCLLVFALTCATIIRTYHRFSAHLPALLKSICTNTYLHTVLHTENASYSMHSNSLHVRIGNCNQKGRLHFSSKKCILFKVFFFGSIRVTVTYIQTNSLKPVQAQFR